MATIKRLLFVFACATALYGQDVIGNLGIINVHYTNIVLIPRWPRPDTVTIRYDDLYPGKRSVRGGCWFMDMTKPGSPILIVEDSSDHVTVRAVRGHAIKWDCNWNVVDPEYKGPKK